jgi:hypothetical protein
VDDIDWLREIMNFPKMRSLPSLVIDSEMWFPFAMLNDGNPAERAHQPNKQHAKHHSNHGPREMRDMLSHAVAAFENALVMKGFRWGPGLNLSVGARIQDGRDPRDESRLNPFYHPHLLVPHHGVCVCVCLVTIHK